MGSMKTVLLSYNKTGFTGPVTQFAQNIDFRENIPDEILEKMLNTEADAIEPEIRKNASTMLNQKGYSIGGTAKSIKRKRSARDRFGYMYVEINFNGARQDGKKATEIAFLNEYGLGETGGRQDAFYDKMGGRFFIQKAIDAKEDEAFDNAEKIFRDWQEKQ